MAGPRQPTDLLVLNGRKHLTKAEAEARRAAEVKAPPPKSKRVKPPAYLPESLHKKFRALAKQLIEIGILAEIDYDCLARYLLAEQAYLAVTEQVNRVIENQAISLLEDLSKTQTRYFNQCDRAAAALGLTISSRCRLVVPKPPEDEAAGDPLAEMLRERAERRRRA